MKKTLSILFLFTLLFSSCKTTVKSENESQITENNKYKYSLAQWSLNIPMRNGEMDPLDFAKEASEMNFEGLEYVSQLYKSHWENAENKKDAVQILLEKLKAESESYGLENLLIMIDGEGDLSVTDKTERNQAVENHKLWVDAAKFLGCHSIRINLFGASNEEEWKANSIDALQLLGAYAAEKNINILVENHGGLSSNAKLLMEVFDAVNLPNCGTLPDFGNFCLKRENNERWSAPCIEEYDKYEGIKELLPRAFGVSAKSYHFNDQGDETTVDYYKMMEIVKDSNYEGFIGIEYEGTEIPPKEGIILTRDLLIKASK